VKIWRCATIGKRILGFGMTGVSFKLIDSLGLLLVLVLLAGALSGCSQLYPVDPETRLVFQDDFSNPESGWHVQAGPAGSMGYQESLFWIQVQAPQTNLVASLPENYWFPVDVEVEVQARKAVGPNDNLFGVICRYQDDLNYYWFVISSDGYYGIGKVKEGRVMLINRDQMPPSEVIQQNDSWNNLRATCIGSTLSFYVNGYLVDHQQDADFAAGNIGLMAGSGATGQVFVTFDRLMVKEAEGR